MSLRNRLVLPVILSALAVLAGCGSGSTPVIAPPTGGFSNTNLSGTYVFSTLGSDQNNILIATAGTFNASQGKITGGTMDVNDPAVGQLVGQPITGGSYSVGADGRPGSQSGVLKLQTAAGTFAFDFVMTSTEHGLITEFDSNGSGSGTIDFQGTVSQSSISGKSFAFNLNGIGGISSSTGAETPFSTVGAFTLGSSDITSGIEDFNNGGFSVCGTIGCAMAGFVDLSTVPGTASFSSNAGTFNFDVYPVDATHLKLIETDTAPPIVSGDVFAQASSIPTGNNVFTVAGFDGSVQGPFTAAGILDTDGNGGIKSDSVEDINDAGTSGEVGSVTGGTAIGGSYTSVTGGRSVITLSGFVNGNNLIGCGECQFAAYPSSGGTQLLEIDGGGVTAGVAYPQGGSPTLASGQGYGMNLSGSNSNSEEDDIAEFTNTSGTWTGHVDFNDIGNTSFNNTFSSAYAADSTVTGRGTVTAGTNGFNLVTYIIDGSTVAFVEIDNNQVGLGSLVTQNASASSNAAMRQLTVLQMKPGAKANMKSKLKRR